MTIRNIMAQNSFEWSVIKQLPTLNEKQFGMGGALSGIHENTLLIIGGSNFAGVMPWKGGKKRYLNDIYVLRRTKKDTFEWFEKTFTLPFNIAYAATVSTPNGIYCIGGENENGIRKEVFLIKWDTHKQDISIENLPSLPEEISNASAVEYDNFIYVLGGENAEKTSNKAYRLNVKSNPNSWEVLPNLPTPLSHSVSFAGQNALYLIGGRAKVPSDVSQLSHYTYKFDIKQDKWLKMADISIEDVPINALSAGCGVMLTKNKFLLIGGDRGNIFSKIEAFNLKIAQATSEDEKSQLQAEKESILENHQGFSKDLLVYHTRNNTWKKIGEVPILVPVTTSSLRWGKDIVIPSGEIKPGIRTVDIILGKSIK